MPCGSILALCYFCTWYSLHVYLWFFGLPPFYKHVKPLQNDSCIAWLYDLINKILLQYLSSWTILLHYVRKTKKFITSNFKLTWIFSQQTFVFLFYANFQFPLATI